MQANVNAAQKTKYKRAAQVKEKEKQQYDDDDDDDDDDVKNNVSLTKLKQEFSVVTVITSIYTVVLKSLSLQS